MPPNGARLLLSTNERLAFSQQLLGQNDPTYELASNKLAVYRAFELFLKYSYLFVKYL